MKNTPTLPPPPMVYRIVHSAMGPIPRTLELCCRSAFELCCEQMDRSLTRGQSVRLRFHLSICGICRNLPAQFQGMRRLIRAACQQEHDGPCGSGCMSEEAKQRIYHQLKNEGEK